jgi:hypothetical protein
MSRLRRVRGPRGDGHGSARHHRRREERRGVREVRLDVDRLAARRAGRDDPLARGDALDVHASVRERLDRHLDVRQARQTLATVDQVQADIESRCREQQAGHELARLGRVDLELAPADVTAAVNRERQAPIAAVVDVDAEVAERLDHGAHGAVQGVVGGREVDVSLGESQKRCDEAHDGARLAAVDRASAGQCVGGCDREVVTEGSVPRCALDADAERAQRVLHAR